MRFAKRIEGFDGPSHDFADAFVYDDMIVAVIADGAGTGGDRIARGVVEGAPFFALDRPPQWVESLASLDRSGRGGEAAAVVAQMSAAGVAGASVGDSGAWLIGAEGFIDLTQHQRRKPLLGSGESVPVAFSHPPAEGTLLLASDGLFKYAPAERICEIARGHDLDAAAAALIDAVRLRSGALQDDVAVVLCRL